MDRIEFDVDDFDFSLDQVLATGTQVDTTVVFDFGDTTILVRQAALATFGADDFIL